MRDLPAALRPRERVLAGEEAGLTDEELLALVIQSGRPWLSARDLARRLLDRAGGLAGAAEWGTAELARVPGIGPAKTAALRAAFLLARRLGGAGLRPGVKIASSADVCRHLAPRLRGARREEFLALLLDSGHHLIREAAVTSGTLDQSLVHPRETFAPAIEARAAAVIIAHNHPSGDPQPSAEDVEVTARLREAGRLLGIQLLDHVIIGGDGYYSFAENGLLEGGAP
ncbi:MAG: DNA repair protein RadC [Planctomycetes bacterium]|nr:DNA repair protein RadC [Planctomycetota bacterium]